MLTACQTTDSAATCKQALGSAASAESGISPGTFQTALSNPNLDNLVHKAVTEGAGAALMSALPAGMGNLGVALGQLADSAQKEAPELSNALGMGAPSTYSGGGGTGASKSTKENFLSSLFGGGLGASRAPQSSTNTTTFGESAPSTDIWHTNSLLSLFQIVSNKIEKITPRFAK